MAGTMDEALAALERVAVRAEQLDDRLVKQRSKDRNLRREVQNVLQELDGLIALGPRA